LAVSGRQSGVSDRSATLPQASLQLADVLRWAAGRAGSTFSRRGQQAEKAAALPSPSPPGAARPAERCRPSLPRGRQNRTSCSDRRQPRSAAVQSIADACRPT
jgi:hypothetical protein